MPFLEIVAALVAVPVVAIYTWRGVRRRRRAALTGRGETPPRVGR
jgi:hypothetical protein